MLADFVLRPRLATEQLWWSSASTGAGTSNINGRHDETVTGQIQTLAQLRKEGAISDEEFNRLKKRALA